MSRRLMILFFAAVLTVTAAFAGAEGTELRGWNKKDRYQYVVFGNYPTEKDGTVAPVVWRVLDVREDGTALLLTNLVIDGHYYQYVDPSIDLGKVKYRDYREMTWENSDLRPWMQEEMLPALLSEEERTALTEYDGDLLFLLTREDYLNTDYGFSASVYGTRGERICAATPYARKQGVYQGGNGATYWTATVREPADRFQGQIVGYDGHLSYAIYGRRNVGVRPAILIRTDAVRLTEGSGTAKDPYIMEIVY